MSNYYYEEFKVEMDAQATLITALIEKIDKESSEAIKCLCPLSIEVYIEVFSDKYKHLTFPKFNEDDNPRVCITIFEIEFGTITINEKLKLQQFQAPLKGNALRWFNDC